MSRLVWITLVLTRSSALISCPCLTFEGTKRLFSSQTQRAAVGDVAAEAPVLPSDKETSLGLEKLLFRAAAGSVADIPADALVLSSPDENTWGLEKLLFDSISRLPECPTKSCFPLYLTSFELKGAHYHAFENNLGAVPYGQAMKSRKQQADPHFTDKERLGFIEVRFISSATGPRVAQFFFPPEPSRGPFVVPPREHPAPHARRQVDLRPVRPKYRCFAHTTVFETVEAVRIGRRARTLGSVELKAESTKSIP